VKRLVFPPPMSCYNQCFRLAQRPYRATLLLLSVQSPVAVNSLNARRSDYLPANFSYKQSKGLIYRVFSSVEEEVASGWRPFARQVKWSDEWVLGTVCVNKVAQSLKGVKGSVKDIRSTGFAETVFQGGKVC